MKRTWIGAIFAAALLGGASFGSEAASSASAGRGGYGAGTGSAAARYEGDHGFARTDSRSGRLTTARGVAVGVDEDGLSLSISNAFAPPHGPAVATSFNLSIGRDGQVSGSTGLSVADGPFYRTATAGGQAATGFGAAPALAYASGQTDPFGRVVARTQAQSSGPRIVGYVARPGELGPRSVTVLRRPAHVAVQPRTVVIRPGGWR
jgi:hypothetical protein